MKLAIFLFFSLIFQTHAIAQPFCQGTLKNPCLILNDEKNPSIVRNFRDSMQIAHQYQGHTVGLNHLFLSGSGQPNVEGWQTIVNHINTLTHHKIKTIIDLDLRQETHGYVNNRGLSVMTQHDWGNLGKSQDEILKEENKWLKELKQKNIISVLTTKQYKEKKFSQGKTILVHSVQSEENAATRAGLKYFRLTITDHRSPLDHDVDQFIMFVRHLPPHAWLHIHCAAGDGRTTTFMAMYDMLRNADHVSLEEIIKRQAAVSPYYNLWLTERKNIAYAKYYQQRVDFLKKFYLYSLDYLDGYSGDWSHWLTTHSNK